MALLMKHSKLCHRLDKNMNNLFGTDGIRGVANEYPMTPEMALNIGRAVAFLFRKDDGRPKIIIGKDTRISGDMIECGLVSGICSMGGIAHLVGILPTSGVAFMTASTNADAGIMISASHNPFYDNGIKIFKGDGYKPADTEEREIEQLVLGDKLVSISGPVRETGRVHLMDDAVKSYASFLKGTLPETCSLKGMKIVIDCSNGATFKVAPQLFNELGADVDALFINPDGKNINERCGSQHPEILAKKVVENSADIGFAFDGDGDRLVAVDEKGAVLTGDQVLAICAKSLNKRGLLMGNRVVITVMSNMGVRIALKDMGIDYDVAKVGDRHVVEKMISTGATLGGEDSGHTIFLDQHTTGDGMLTALNLIEAMTEESSPLSELSKIMTILPQVLLNVEVRRKPEIEDVPEIMEIIKSIETHLSEKGRVLVRYSGTQPFCRIMVEGPNLEDTDRFCRQIAEVVKAKLA